jgi:enolase
LNPKIKSIDGLEILDSRGFPTLRVSAELDGGIRASASVPSGASTGESEALELRDGEANRYSGRGVRHALSNLREKIAPRLVGLEATRQNEIDRLMIDLDGTPNKGRLGANAILGASLAVARAASVAAGRPLYSYLAGLAGWDASRLPVPMMNILNGGKHADNSLDFQEFMVMPVGAPTFAEALRYGAEVFHTLKGILKSRGLSTGVGDEGGFAPDLSGNEEACQLIVEAIRKAGFEPGSDVAIALDPAASSFRSGEVYALSDSGEGIKTSAEMIDLFSAWVEKYPIVSIEDGLAEDDWESFRIQTERIGDRVQIVGDDMYSTNPALIRRGIAQRATNAVLIKPNQIGTLTETIEAVQLCREAGWRYVISHRSGETEDAFLADLAVAMGGGQIKTGSACRGERIAKYNRLLEIEMDLGPRAGFSNPFAPRAA